MAAPETDVDGFLEALKGVAKERLSAVYSFGSDLARGKGKGQPRLLVVVDRIDRELLDQVGPVVSEAQQDGIRVRIDTTDNLVRGADAFPAFTLELIRHRSLLSGKDVLTDLRVNTADLRLHVEHGLRGLFRDLVNRYIDHRVHGQGLLEMRRAARRLFFLLEGALMAQGREIGDNPDPAEIVALTRQSLGNDSDVPWKTLDRFLSSELRLDTDGMRQLYDAMFAILHRVIDHVDRMAD